jgi:hypothetical protein
LRKIAKKNKIFEKNSKKNKNFEKNSKKTKFLRNIAKKTKFLRKIAKKLFSFKNPYRSVQKSFRNEHFLRKKRSLWTLFITLRIIHHQI